MYKWKMFVLIIFCCIVCLQIDENKSKDELSKKEWNKRISTFYQQEGEKKEGLVEDDKKDEFLDDFESYCKKKKVEELIYGYASLGEVKLSKKIKKKMIKNFALKLGIKDGYKLLEVENKTQKEYVLNKAGKYANTTIKIIEKKGKRPSQYILVSVKTKENFKKACFTYQNIKRVYQEIGMEAKVFLDCSLQSAGKCSKKDKKQWMKETFLYLDVDNVKEVGKNDIFTVYGYSKKNNEYYNVDGKKVNMQVSMFYDEIKNQTEIKIGVPFVNTVY